MQLSGLLRSKSAKHFLTIILLLVLGHTFGTYYLNYWGRRQLMGGLYISSLSPGDVYATIEWDEFVYFPRALAVAQGYSPLDPWVYHENAKVGWGPFPLYPPLIFGILTRLSGDLHIALYIAVILSTVLQGVILVWFFQRTPLQLSFFGAIVATICFLKAPWFAVNVLQFSASGYSLKGFIGGVPTDAFVDVEAGLFTYLPYVAFLVLFWSLMENHQGERRVIAAGMLCGALTYVYFYHQIFAFLLLASATVIALIERDWNRTKRYILAAAIGVLCAIPHFTQLLVLRTKVDLLEYMQRLGFEDGRFDVQNLVYLRHLLLVLAVGAIYTMVRRPNPTKALCLRLLAAMVIAYVLVLNLRVMLGFDMNSDHYWRMSLGLPATLWMIVATADLLKDLANRSAIVKSGTPVVVKILLVLIIMIALRNQWGAWDPERYEKGARFFHDHITVAQNDMIGRMQLLKTLLQPGDVLLVADPETAYHAVVNFRARLLVPSGMSVLSNREILERYFVAQYFSGARDIRGPRDSGRPREPNSFVHAAGEHLFLFVNYSAKGKGAYGLDDKLMQMIQDTSVDEAERIYARSKWRVDVIFGHDNQREVALARIAKYFRVLEVRKAGPYWAVRVKSETDLAK